MPWIPIDRLPEEAKDGRPIIVGSAGKSARLAYWAEHSLYYYANWRAVCDPTHFYDFGEGRTMPDAPEGE